MKSMVPIREPKMSHWKLTSLTLLTCLALVAPRAIQAQHVHFEFGGGHHHHGWHHHWHDPCWHGHCWGPPALGFVYAPPPPVIRERVVYVDPPRARAWTPQTTTAAAPVPPANATYSASAKESRITIRNGAAARLPVTFLVDGQDIELADGAAQTFSGPARRTVTYDRGGRFGSTQQELTAGDYEFRITASGWDLVRRPDSPAGRTAVRTNSLPQDR